jgi:hypothetical protein
VSTTVNEFSEYYRKLTNGELLALARQRRQLASDACVALDVELDTRGLGPEAIREFEDQATEKAEPDVEDASGDLPPPTELPDDWFDDHAEESTGSLSSARPKGVTVCAFIFWLSGITTTGWGALAFSGNLTSRSAVISLLAIILGVVHCVIGFGLWRLVPWARKLAEVFCWCYVALVSFGIVGNAYIRLRGFAVDAEKAIWQFVGLLWQLLWALYLGRQSTRDAFVAPEQNGGNRRV